MWVVLCPPSAGPFDGISDYAARLTGALDALHPTRRIAAGSDPLPAADAVDGVILQYFPGTPLDRAVVGLRSWLTAIRARRRPILATVHEYWPPADGTVRRWVHRRLARRQLRTLLADVDGIVVAQEISERELRASGLVGSRPIAVVPVGSNITVTAPEGARDGGLVVFGQPAAMDPVAVREVVRWIGTQTAEVKLTWVARSAEELDRWWAAHAIGDRTRVTVQVALSEADVSAVLRRATLGLALHADGTSGRRTTLAALLAHGVPTIGIEGKATDRWIGTCDGLVLVSQDRLTEIPGTIDAVMRDAGRLTAMSAAAWRCAEQYVAWPVIAARYASLLSSITQGHAE